MFLSPALTVGASGGDGFSSGRISLEAGDGSDSLTSFVAVTVKTYFTSLVSPVSVQVVVAHSWLKPPAECTVYLVMAAPLSDGGAHLRTAVRLRTSVAVGADGVSGRSRTVIRTRPSVCRETSSVLSMMVYRTTITPLNPAPGVTVIESPVTEGCPVAEPVSTVAEVIRSGVSGNGLKSLASTLMVSDLPALAFCTTSSFAAGSGRLEATTVAVTVARTGSERPSVTSSGMLPFHPAALAESGVTFKVALSTLALKPSGNAPSSSNLSLSWSPASTSFARFPSSRVVDSPAGTSRVAPLKVGGWLALGSGITLVMMLRVDFSPAGSSGPAPSVTSNVTEPGPT